MFTAYINRLDESQVQTLGVMNVYRKLGLLFSLKTLELPYLNNERNLSCIPTGSYNVKLTPSLRHGGLLYEVLDVPGRDGIRFDKANYFSELKGCIAVGLEYVDVNGDGFLDVTNSGACHQFMRDILGNEFKLIIK